MEFLSSLIGGKGDSAVKVSFGDDDTKTITDAPPANLVNKIDFMSVIDTVLANGSGIGSSIKTFIEAVKPSPTAMDLIKECSQLANMRRELDKHSASGLSLEYKTQKLIDDRFKFIEKKFQEAGFDGRSDADRELEKQSSYKKIAARKTKKKDSEKNGTKEQENSTV